MDLKVFTQALQAHWHQMRTEARKDEGLTSGEIAAFAGALLGIAALVLVAISDKVQEKIGIINSG